MKKKKMLILAILVVLFLAFIASYLVEPASSIDINETVTTTTITGGFIKFLLLISF